MKKEHGRYRYERNPQTSGIFGQSDVLAVLFFIFRGHDRDGFLQQDEHGDEKYAGKLVFRNPHPGGNDFGGPVQPVCGRSKKAVCVDIVWYSGLSDGFFEDFVLHGGSLSCVYLRGHCLRPDDACRWLWDPALLRADLSTGDLLRSCRLSAVDRGFGTDGRKRKVPFLGDDHFYGTWDLIGDIHKSGDFSPRIWLILTGSYWWKSGIFS